MRTVLIILAFLAIPVIVLVLVLSHHGSKTPNTNPNPITGLTDSQLDLEQVSYLQDGSINGDDQHYSIRITVDHTSRVIDIIQGYQGKVVNSKTYANNDPAFRAFLAALQVNGFTSGRKKPTIKSIDGQCALGFRYIFSASGVPVMTDERWATSCSSTLGTFGGNLINVQKLFKNQISDYNNLTRNVRLADNIGL